MPDNRLRIGPPRSLGEGLRVASCKGLTPPEARPKVSPKTQGRIAIEAKAIIRLKRIYEPPSEDDGFRILVERLWPRGFSKERAHVALWLKDIAPSPALRTWYAHDVARWEEFERRYRAELRGNPVLGQLRAVLQGHPLVTFLFAARDVEHNSALVLKAFLEEDAAS